MQRTVIQLTDEQMHTLKELAKARKVSVARVIRESVDYYVKSTSTLTQEEKKLRALKILDMKFHDIHGATDVSVNHDKYLDEIYGEW
jgi:hypothetical protein